MLGSNVACELAVSINLLLVHSSYQYTSVLIHLDGVFTQRLGPGLDLDQDLWLLVEFFRNTQSWYFRVD